MIPATVHLGSRAGGKAAVVARRAAVGFQHRTNAAAPAPAPASAVQHQLSTTSSSSPFLIDNFNVEGVDNTNSHRQQTRRQYHILTSTKSVSAAAAASPASSSPATKLVRVGNTNHFRWFSEKPPSSGEAEEGEPKTTETEAEEAATAAEGEGGTDGGDDDTAEKKLQALEEEVKSIKDQMLRSLAEQENIRNIARRDVDAAKQFSIKSFAKSLLEVADNLDRALEAATATSDEETTLTATQSVESFLEGVQLTSTGLTKALQSNGVTAFCEQPGDVFDPETMNALMEYPDPSGEPGTVGQVIKKGYMLNGRVLRPAEVGVIKKV